MPPVIRRPRGPRKARPSDETVPTVTEPPPRAREPEHHVADLDLSDGIGEGRDLAGVGAQDGDVTVEVRAGERCGYQSSVAEVDLGLFPVQVVRIRHDQTRCDDDSTAGPFTPTTDGPTWSTRVRIVEESSVGVASAMRSSSRL